MLQNAMNWLRAMERENLSATVGYLRPGAASAAVRAVPGRSLFRAENDYGVTVRTETRDFIIEADALADEPQRGDVIVFNGCRYEVLAPNNEPVWRWSDVFRVAYRIHTKGIS